MTQIKITITDKGKKAELELSDTDQMDKLLIIQSVFKLFEIDLDSLEFSKSYKQLHRAYDGFFKSMQSEEPQIQTKQIDTYEIAQRMEEGLTQQEDIKIQETQYWNSGTKERDGQIVYVCRYECHVCKDKGNHYLPKDTQEVKCRGCGSKLKVYPAHPDGESRDTHGNWLRAGEYKDWKIWD